MIQQRLFPESETVRRADRASFLKEAACTAAEGYWNHDLSGFEAVPVGPGSAPVGRRFTAECSKCGAHVEVRPYKGAVLPNPGYPAVGGPAVSMECSPERDFSNETEGRPSQGQANSEPGD